MAESSIAVLIDYENLARGMAGDDHAPKSQNGRSRGRGRSRQKSPAPNVRAILERLVEIGRIVSKRAYCDWQLFTDSIQPLHELGIELIEIPDRQYTGKNSADIRLVADAVEMCLTRDHIGTFAILSGDSDFTPLVAKLKEYGKDVIGVGMKGSTSQLLVENCDQFIYYEDIVAKAGLPNYEDRVPQERHACFELLLQTIDAILRENEGPILASRLKETMRRKQPSFTERSYGYKNFTALLRDAAELHLIDVHTDPRSGTVTVDGFAE